MNVVGAAYESLYTWQWAPMSVSPGQLPAANVPASTHVVTPERAASVEFCDPYVIIGQTVLMNRKLAGAVKSVADLDKPEYTILAKLGTTGDIAAKKQFKRAKLRTFEHQAEAAIEVQNGRADGFVYDLPFNAVMAAR